MAMILTGERLQIRRHHADRILAVDRITVVDRAVVSAGRTWALLNELLEAGYSKIFLAKQLGAAAPKRASRIPETDLKGAVEECK